MDDWLDARDEARADARAEARAEIADDEHEARERFGFNVCRTGVCDEPCGDDGGCRR